MEIEQDMRLPETFASTFRDEMREACHLTVPTGETHKVALIEEDCKLWFDDGWEQFMDRFSIGYGYFLVFTYVENSNFKVNVFDLTACEIPYQCDNHTNSPATSEPNNLGNRSPEFSEQLNSVDNLHSSPASEQQPAVVDVLELESEDDEMNSEELSETTADSGDGSDASQFGSRLPKWLRNYKEEIKGATAAGILVPSNPFFVDRIKPYALHRGRFLNIPRAFAQRYMKCKAGDSIRIGLGDGKQWLVRCCRSSTLLNCSFGKGWLQFAQDVGLEVGDVCFFELTDVKNTVFKVHIAAK
ncbi:B3 domain-containing transcription factor VRN1-like isoform X2 [Silene latifolia]|uniref:B3 domain-containing transcription factor VRN1-like isoform X2 n=1 Tax=Silene latifolia TaxID=37657 RepID=UPI003D76D05D